MRERKSKSRFRRFVGRIDFTLRSAIAALLLLVLFAYAISDFVLTATRKEHQIQESVLRGELSQFLLATREPDGSSLLENPEDFTRASRPAQVVSVRRPFFSYFLTKANARTLRTDDLHFDPPRACTLSFISGGQVDDGVAPSFIDACFAAVPSDPSGRYIYFAIRYPSKPIQRHQQGAPFDSSDRLYLKFSRTREVQLVLTYQRVPPVRATRNNSSDKFEDLHEVAAYLADDAERSTRLLNAQAYERRGNERDQNKVTILGRIDSSLVLPEERNGKWPTAGIQQMKIGIEVISASGKRFGFNPGTEGTAAVSLEQAYRLSVPSRATVTVASRDAGPKDAPIWTSTSLLAQDAPTNRGLFQSFADRIARLIVARVHQVEAQQEHHLTGMPPMLARVAEDQVIIPDIAARSLAWQFAALAAIFALIAVLWGGYQKLEQLTRASYAAWKGGVFDKYADSTDQIGTIGRVIYLLRKHDQERMRRHLRRVEREAKQKEDALRQEQEILEFRKGMLEVVGHEIRSPLASLLAATHENPNLRRNVERMDRAISSLNEATSIEEMLLSGGVSPQLDDLAAFMHAYLDSLACRPGEFVGYGDESGLMAVFDDVTMAQVVDNLLSNAERYVQPNTPIEISWESQPDCAVVTFFNQGPQIPDCDEIFKFGHTDQKRNGHLGLGLYASRLYLKAMRGSIKAENRPNGVAFVIQLAKA